MRYFAVICEARADFETATELADRIFVGTIDWLDSELLEHLRVWQAGDASNAFLTWAGLKDLAREHGIRVHGHFGGEPAEPDARAARRALLLLRRLRDQLHGVLLIRDDDGDSRRRTGLEQARAEVTDDFPIVVGLARTKRECWVLAGFEPHDDVERERLHALRAELGFDPIENAQELTAKHQQDCRSAKRVLAELTSHDLDRERCCWRETPLQSLRARGARSGLKAYLHEVEHRLTPVLLSEEPNS